MKFTPNRIWSFIGVHFFLKDHLSTFKTKPISFLQYLLRNKEHGSLSFILKKRGLVFDVFSFIDYSKPVFDAFEIRATLTKKGVHEFETVLNCIASYFFYLKELLRDQDSSLKKSYKNWAKQKKIQVFNKTQSKGMDYCSRIAKNMFNYEICDEEVLFSHVIPVFQQDFEHIAKKKSFFDVSDSMVDEGLDELRKTLEQFDGTKSVVFLCSRGIKIDEPNPTVSDNYGRRGAQKPGSKLTGRSRLPSIQKKRKKKIKKKLDIHFQDIYGVEYTKQPIKRHLGSMFNFNWSYVNNRTNEDEEDVKGQANEYSNLFSKFSPIKQFINTFQFCFSHNLNVQVRSKDLPFEDADKEFKRFRSFEDHKGIEEQFFQRMSTEDFKSHSSDRKDEDGAQKSSLSSQSQPMLNENQRMYPIKLPEVSIGIEDSFDVDELKESLGGISFEVSIQKKSKSRRKGKKIGNRFRKRKSRIKGVKEDQHRKKHQLYLPFYSLPEPNPFFLKFEAYMDYQVEEPFFVSETKAKLLTKKLNFISYYSSGNPVNRFMSSIKAHLFELYSFDEALL